MDEWLTQEKGWRKVSRMKVYKEWINEKNVNTDESWIFINRDFKWSEMFSYVCILCLPAIWAQQEPEGDGVTLGVSRTLSTSHP